MSLYESPSGMLIASGFFSPLLIDLTGASLAQFLLAYIFSLLRLSADGLLKKSVCFVVTFDCLRFGLLCFPQQRTNTYAPILIALVSNTTSASLLRNEFSSRQIFHTFQADHIAVLILVLSFKSFYQVLPSLSIISPWLLESVPFQ